TVNAHSTTYQNFYLKRVRNTPPEVVSYSPMWNEGDPALLCSTPIVLQFNWDMDIESVKNAFSVEPAVEGTIKWEDTNYRMVFTPTDAYEVNTLYTVHLDKSAKHGGGTEMENDFEFKFYTQGRNHLNVLAMFPDEGDKVHYKSGAYVEFRTDSLLDAHDLYTHFHVYDKAGEELDFNKRNIKNNKKGDPYGYIRLPLLKALTPGDEYKFVVDNDLCDTVGIHLPAELSVNFTATDASLDAPEGSEVVDDFETMTLAVDDQFSEDVKTSTLSLATDAMSGSKSLQLKYEFTSPNSGKMRFNYPQAEASPRLLEESGLVFVKGQTLGISVNGDMSYNTLYAIFEHEGLEEIVPLTQITYHGWRYCNVALDMLPDDVPCKLVGFEFEKNATLMGSSGTVKFDALMREPTSGISTTTLLGVHVGPNPASEYLVAEADCYISGVELLDSNGRVIARHAGNFINVSNIASGVYFMRVWVNGFSSTHKVVVSH
ncbi:MAG: Ig-like domain-containing protein, partial [Muribaculaceae bacterium]|nr:Ig-like domain-containing protein [Muribaculaceae bacterium]